MNKKIKILLEDDTEILGNGLGNVMLRQYLPVQSYLGILKKYGIRSTFYVDMAHLKFLKDNKDFEDFELQAEILEKLISKIGTAGMDVQLHIHAQWLNAKIENNFPVVTQKWNLGQLEPEEQVKLFSNCYQLLLALKKKTDSSAEVVSFKAGSWGLQPFEHLYPIFQKKGVDVVLGPIKGLKVDSLKIDYSGMETNLPYWCDCERIEKIGTEGIAIFPLTPTWLSWPDLAKYAQLIYNRKKNSSHYPDLPLNIPKRIKNMTPLEGKDKLHYSGKPFQTHLKINAQPFWYLKKTFDRAFDSAWKEQNDNSVIIIETHTKDFLQNLKDIDCFFSYLIKNYGEKVDFVTATDLHYEIKEGSLKPLTK